jgi:D-alanyl-D-alanine carboxypeptidase/D-alanyl-D-alanine-endopeptidase (penicillin-binding protein 4)
MSGLNMFRRAFSAGAILLFLNGCVAVPSAKSLPAGLPANVVSMLAAAKIPVDAMGAMVRRIPDDTTVLSHQAETSLQPASTLKVLTSIAGLEKLGPTYRGRTELRTRGDLADGVLLGDLILRGVGNPDLEWEAFQRMLQTLRHKGIVEIRGNLVLDRTWFQPARLDVGVPPFDETPEFRYNVIPDALLLNTNLLQLDLQSADQITTTGMQVGMSPTLERVTIVSNMTFIDRACDKWEDGWKLPTVSRSSDGAIRVELQGEFPKNCWASTSINILDRTDFADRLFRTLWRNLGGTFAGQTREGEAGDASGSDTRLLAQHQSRTLAEVTRDINKRSDNTMTRMLLLSMGALAANDRTASTAERGANEVRAWLKSHGINDAGLVLENGSGLSRIERIRPDQLVAVLSAAYRSNWAPEFIASLPIVAVDGGMRNRLRSSPAAGHARIKTGSLRDVAAVAGYVQDANNQTNIVVAMINHPLATGNVARPILDALIDWVARQPAADATNK